MPKARRTSLLAAAALAGMLAACERPAPPSPPDPPPPAPAPAPAPAPGPTAACPPILTPGTDAPGETLAEIARSRGSVRVIVQLAPPSQGVQPAQARAGAMAAMAEAGVAAPTLISDRLSLVAAEMTADQLAIMQSAPGIATMTEDRIAFPTLAQSGPLIQAPDLWALGGRGAGQAVAILDTGVDRTHPFLAGRVVAEACFSSNSPANGATSVCPNGQTSQTGAGAAAPCNADGCEHGTHVAGIAAGEGADFSGVAPDAGIIAVQVFSRFSGAACGGAGATCVASFTSDQIRALDFVLQQAATRKVASVNMSLGGGRARGFCDNDLTKASIDALRTAGVATVIASGNDGYRDSVSFPGCISSAITVGATSKQDRIAAFSNCGGQVDLHAPGVAVRSSVPGTGFAAFSGTSMATPQVAGAFAAIRSRTPTASIDQIEAALKATGPDVDGRPRINVFKASLQLSPAPEVAAVAQAPQSPPAPPVQPAAPAGGLDQLGAGEAVRAIIALKPPSPGSPAALASALFEAEAAAKAAGITHIERMGASPMIVVEGTAEQVRKLAAAPGVAQVQIDHAAKTQ
jgi:subtilisin family serine protease